MNEEEKKNEVIKEEVSTVKDESIKNVDEKKEKKAEVKEERKTEEKTKAEKPSNPIKQAFSIVFKILAWAIIILLVVIIVRAVAFKKHDVFGYRFYTIMSGSMEPTIHVGDAVISKEKADYKEQDVIAFQHGDAITVHRIIGVTEENGTKFFKTKGDNNNTEDDGLITKDKIMGIVEFRINKGGDAILWVQKNIVIVVAVIVVIMIIIIARRLI